MHVWTAIDFFDDRLGSEKSFEALLDGDPQGTSVFVAIGSNLTRQRLQLRLAEAGFSLADIAHASAVVSGQAVVGKGSLIAAGAIIGPGAIVGRGCIINTAASVDHDCRLGDFVHISPGARLAGTVSIGDRSWIGLGAAVIENVTIGADAMVAAGAVVIRDVEANMKVMGVPAR